MATAKVTPDGLSPADERFAHLVATGDMSQVDAFIATHPKAASWDRQSAHVDASHLAAKLRPRIQQLAAATQAAAVAEVAWDRVRLVTEAAENLRLARTGGWRGAGSANGALEIIGRATGLLNDKQQGPAQVQVTQIIINAPPGYTGPLPGMALEAAAPSAEALDA